MILRESADQDFETFRIAQNNSQFALITDSVGVPIEMGPQKKKLEITKSLLFFNLISCKQEYEGAENDLMKGTGTFLGRQLKSLR